MYLELPEILRCPKCGPEHGLVLLVRGSSERRVLEGWLGCPNCGRDFPVAGGVADLRLDPERSSAAASPYAADELAVKIGALAGLTGGGGYVLLDERLAHVAGELADLLPEVEIVVLSEGAIDAPERPGVSRVRSEGAAPIAPFAVRAAAVAGEPGEHRTALARTVGAGGRMVLFDTGDRGLDFLDAAGYEIVAREGDVAVARRSGGR